MICRADEHYDVVRGGGGGDGVVVRLQCKRCDYAVLREQVSGANSVAWGGGRSGTPRYNRMRAKMVRHVHRHHLPWTVAS